MPGTQYSVIEIRPEWALEPEPLGSKEKVWYRRAEGEPEWLFKFPQPNTGQHWAEKVAAELAALAGIRCARVELAIFRDQRGSTTESFIGLGCSLFHGNQVLAGQVLGYDPERRFRQTDHTLANVFLALERLFGDTTAAEAAKTGFAEYLVLDAIIGNTDRHHENWGILRSGGPNQGTDVLAPSFDHASSLGRELRDDGEGKCRRQILEKGRIGAYAEKAPGAVYWTQTEKKPIGPLELVRRAVRAHPNLFRAALEKALRLDRDTVESVLKNIPEEWMSLLARRFALELVCYNLQELGKLRS